MKKLIILLISLAIIIAGCTGNKTQYELADKTFYNTVDEFGNSQHSSIWFGKDGSFVFTDNFFDGTYQILGKWSLSENVINLDVESSGVGDFKKLLFEVKDDQTLELKTSIAGSLAGQTFTTDESKLVDSGSGTANNINGVKVKKYINAVQDNQFGNSYIEFFDDGTFKFSEIEGMGASLIEGKWSLMGNQWSSTGDVYALYDITGDNIDYSGNKIYNIEFSITDDNTIVLLTDVKSSFATHVFTSDGKLPEGFIWGSEGPVELKNETWIHAPIADTSPQCYPYIVLNADGTFVFYENVYAGMAQYEGTYSRDYISLVCEVTKHNLQGFAGQDVTRFAFEFISENQMRLDTDLCMSRNGDIFNLSNQ